MVRWQSFKLNWPKPERTKRMDKIYLQTEGKCTWSLERKNDSDLTYYEEDVVKQLQREVKELRKHPK